MAQNPYAPPTAEELPPQPADVALPLFSYEQMVGATFLCGPLAGTVMMALNYRRLDPAKAIIALLTGLMATALVFYVAFELPDSFPGMLVTGIYTALAALVFALTQRTAIQTALAAGAPKASGWRAVGVAGTALVVTATVVIGVAFAIPETKVTYGEQDQHEVIYEDGATEQDARAVGDTFDELGYFDGAGGSSVFVSRDDGDVVVKCVMQDGGWLEASTVGFFREAIPKLRRALGDPVRIELVDDMLRTKKELP